MKPLMRPDDIRHKGERLHLKKGNGPPHCLGEQASQFIWEHRVLTYVALIATLIFVVQLTGFKIR